MWNIVLMKNKPSHITRGTSFLYNTNPHILHGEHRSFKIQTLTYNMANIVLIKYKPSNITW